MTYQSEHDATPPTSRPRGFAAMDKQRQREIARQGGRASHEQGTAHEFTTDEARAAGRRGGAQVSRDRAHMAAIGRRGGAQVSRDRQVMAERGRRGGFQRAARYAARQNGYEGPGAVSPEQGFKSAVVSPPSFAG